jgi:hypothetical protein
VSGETQLRIYRIRAGELDTFVREWRERIVPLREAHGFRVEHAWMSEAESTFVWELAYDGADRDAADRAYHGSPGRAALDPDPARLIESQTTFLARSLDLG